MTGHNEIERVYSGAVSVRDSCGRCHRYSGHIELIVKSAMVHYNERLKIVMKATDNRYALASSQALF